MCELQVAVVRTQVALMFHGDFENMSTFTPGPHHMLTLSDLMDQLESWAGALQPLRQPAVTAAS